VAIAFWNQVRGDGRISEDFRAIAMSARELIERVQQRMPA
jgi:hypothetical protein